MKLEHEHLIGRPFRWGVSDCLSLFRDFYRDNFGIEITDYARPTDWDSGKLDLMRLCYEREGFDLISDWRAQDLRPGDVLCIVIGSTAPNHFAIFLGDNSIIHHLYGRFSSVEPYRDFWRNSAAFVLRHPQVPDLRPQLPDTDIGSLLRARHNL